MILRVEALAERPLPIARRRVLSYLCDESDRGAATHAADDQMAVYRRAGIPGVTERIQIQTLRPVDTEYRCIVPVRWTATGPEPGLFAALDANVELHATGPESTSLAVVGSYVPPLGGAGRQFDRCLLRELAHATVQHFVDRLAALAEQPDTIEAGV